MQNELEVGSFGRRLVQRWLHRRPEVSLVEAVEGRVIAMASGKGGTGKSFLVTNLAVALHRSGRRVAVVDCDFGLMRRSIFDRIQLEKTSGVICLELMKKVHDAGFRIVEVPVHHYHRAFGRSQFFNFRRIARTAVDVMRLWFALVVLGRHRTRAAAPLNAGPDSNAAPTPVSPASPPLDKLGTS